jgi:hypothetical protein
MGVRGFWLPQGTDPRLVPMRLASEHGSGITAWRADDGIGPHGTGYLFEAPGEVAALWAASNPAADANSRFTPTRQDGADDPRVTTDNA